MQQLGPYRIEGELGRGGMGVVLQGHDPFLQRDVAIKLLTAGVTAKPVQRERFMREARALAKLRHPNIVAVHSAGEEAGRSYLVMDLIEGEGLDAVLQRRGPLAERDAALLTYKLARALEYAHARGILHRDLKPSNVLVAPDGEPVLTDFGLAKDLDPGQQSLSKSGAFLGSPGYWAPEQAGGKHDACGPPTDVYGLGATLYAALTGAPPIEGATLIEVLAATATRIPKPPSAHAEVGAEIDRICARCLEKDPALRYPTAGALARDLEVFLYPQGPRDWLRIAVWGLVGLLAPVVLGTSMGVSARSERRLAAVSTRGSSAHDHLQRGHALLRRGEPELALRAYMRASELDPKLAPAYVGRGMANFALGDPKTALAEHRKAAELYGSSDSTPARRSRELLEEAEVQVRREYVTPRAVVHGTDFSKQLEVEQPEAWALIEEGGRFERRGIWRRAKELYDRAVYLAPNSPVPWAARGWALFNLGKLDEALADYQRANEIHPGLYQVHLNMGIAYEAKRDLRSALAAYEVAVSCAPNYAWCYNNRGFVKSSLGDFQGALADYQQAITLDPSLMKAYMNRGVTYAVQGALERALGEFERALTLDPSPQDEEILRGMIARARQTLAQQGR